MTPEDQIKEVERIEAEAESLYSDTEFVAYMI